MKIKEILDPETLNFREALNDPYIFALNCHYQDKNCQENRKAFNEASKNGTAIPPMIQELRCSCRPVMSMTAKSLRELFDNPDEFVLIRIEP